MREKLLSVELHRDNSGVEQLIISGDLPTHETLDRLIQKLGATRRAMTPPVSQAEIATGTSMDLIHDPLWRMHATSYEGAVLTLHHPAFGWLAFGLPWDSAKPLRQTLDKLLPERQDGPMH